MTKLVNLISAALFGNNIWFAKSFNLNVTIPNLITDCDDLIEKYAPVYDEYISLKRASPLIFNSPVNFTNANLHLQHTNLNIALNEFKAELEELKQIKNFFEIILDIVNRNSLYIDAVQKTFCAAIILIFSIIMGCFELRSNLHNSKDDTNLFIFILLSE